MDIGYITDNGKIRTENQDRFLALFRVTDLGEVALCMVADGVGGTTNGSLASDLIARRLRYWWQEELPILLGHQALHMIVSQSLERLIQECNKEIIQQAGRLGISTGTTLSLLFVCRELILIKHVGDSRIYLWRNGEWSLVTRDHTWENQELERGRDPKEDVNYERKKGALVNALGIGDCCRVDTQMLQMARGDRYLICSDGFYRYIDPEQQIQPDGMAQELLDRLSEVVKTTPAVDNYTAVLVINESLETIQQEEQTVQLF